MWGDFVDVTDLKSAALTERRDHMGLTKAETARQMYAHIVANGPGARGEIALTSPGFAWATESACRRAIDDLEGGRRHLKEAQYVEALLAVLHLEPTEAGLAG